MKRPMSGRLSLPSDGLTPEEAQILPILEDAGISRIYGKMPTNRMKAIIALHFECGYTQEQVANIFGISQSRIAQEIARIKDILMGGKGGDQHGYVPRRGIVEVEDLISFVIHAD